MAKVGKNSVRRKVARRVVRILAITVVILTTINLIFMARQVNKSQQKELTLATKLAASDVNTWVLSLRAITTGIAQNLEALNTVNEKTVKKVINEVAEEHEDFIFVYVATESGNMYMARGVGYAAGVDVRERGWYKQTKAAGTTTVINPYISATRPDTMLATVATPIYFNGELVGIVGVDAEIAIINEYIDSLAYENGSYGFLIDSEGRVVSHPNDAFMPSIKEVSYAKDVMPELETILDNPGSAFVSAKDYRGNNMIYTTEKLDCCDWIIGMAFPKSVLSKTLDRGIRIALFVAIVCMLFAAADVTIAIKKILLPIEKINPVLDNILHGDFSSRIDLDAEDDEIGAMQTKLALMIRNLSNVIDHERYILGEMGKGNLAVEDMEELSGEMNEISQSVNSIKESFNDIISDIQFSAINLQSFAMGINETSDLEEMRMVFEELSAEANALMEKTQRFTTTAK